LLQTIFSLTCASTQNLSWILIWLKGLKRGRIGDNNMVILGGADNTFGDFVLSKTKSEVQWLFDRQGWLLRERVFDEKGLGMPLVAGPLNGYIQVTAQASPFCITTQRLPLPWRCLYPQHLLKVLIESCAYSLFVLESQCRNGLSSGLMQILKQQVGYWAQGKHLLYALSQGSTAQWLVQMVGPRVEVERSTILDRWMKCDRSDIEPFIHYPKERCCCFPSLHLVSHSRWLLRPTSHQLAL
jgi:hypothetical protein